jgi:hypothetical protein
MARKTKAQKKAEAAVKVAEVAKTDEDQTKDASEKTPEVMDATAGDAVATAEEKAKAGGKSTQDQASKPADAKHTTCVVIGPKQGRWRIGRHFGPEPTEIPLEDLNEAQGQALQDDPALAISII